MRAVEVFRWWANNGERTNVDAFHDKMGPIIENDKGRRSSAVESLLASSLDMCLPPEAK